MRELVAAGVVHTGMRATLLVCLLASVVRADVALPRAANEAPRLSVRWQGNLEVSVAGVGFPPREPIEVGLAEHNDDGFGACGRDHDQTAVSRRADGRGRFSVRLRLPRCAARACVPGLRTLAAYARWACGLDCEQLVTARFACGG